MSLSFRSAALVALLSSVVAGQSPEGDPQQASPPNRWFQQTEIDLGTFLEGEVAKGHFEFQNPEEKTIEIVGFRPSCTCSQAVLKVGDTRYELSNSPRPHSMYRVDTADGKENRELVEAIPVEGRQAGTIDVEIDLRGVQGPKNASVTIYTNDDKYPMIVVNAKAAAAQYFQVVPSEINLNEMSWQDRREFTARIRSPIRPEFEIVGTDPLPEGMTIEYEKEMQGDAAVWVIRGAYGPNLDPAAAGGLVNFKTDLDGKTAQLRVIAFVKGPLEVRPSTFLAFGRVAHGEGASKTVEFDPTGDFDLQVEKVEFQNLSFPSDMVSYEVRKTEEGILELTIKISPETPKQLVRGDVLVRLNHPAVPEKHLQFNGFVR